MTGAGGGGAAGVRAVPLGGDERLSVGAVTPPIPSDFARHIAIVDAHAHSAATGVRAVGQPGKVGVVHATFAPGRTGKTALSERFVKTPMHITRPLYVDPGDPAHACLYLRTTGGGVAENDRIRQQFTFAPGAQATVTTQAATNVHRMNTGFGSQWTSLSVGEGAVAEYLPGHTTLFAGSRCLQQTDFTVAAGGTLLASEVVMVGRLARGECHEFEAFAQRTRVMVEGYPTVLNDNVCILGPGAGRSLMLYGRWPVWGTLLVVPTAGRPDGLDQTRAVVEELRKSTAAAGADSGDKSVAIGVSTLVGKAGCMVRVAGHSVPEVRGTLGRAHSTARQLVVGRPAFDLRVM
ncbi:urease accessory protein UreD [Corynebacterium heidelbergense]|uniref:urease accessory protein UreD n=1 Tax=Corynebacterium heidelbergense TaxID=2055947 RepID=UPI001EE780D5|nr:urease accessory protein UreD [Corynebacterium heidelbergense]